MPSRNQPVARCVPPLAR